jgi:hypothetical protein
MIGEVNKMISEMQWKLNQSLLELKEIEDFLPIHTHGRIGFKRCRRKWNWQSPLRRHLEPINVESSALWFGTGFHFALEDYHGYNYFGDPVEALLAYKKAHGTNVPSDADELIQLGEGMLRYYVDYWLPDRDNLQTVWMYGEPLVEVRFRIPIPELTKIFNNGKAIMYQGTFDRIVVDKWGNYWVLDYKTAKNQTMQNLSTDPQITAYCWAAEKWLGIPIAGLIYQQHVKTLPKWPRRLKSGGFSTDIRQTTTRKLYKEALIEEYGHVPQQYVEFLNKLAVRETDEGDAFIRRYESIRNDHQKQAEYDKIIAEGYDMLSHDTILYPNPTRDCSWDCDFRTACITMDEGGDYEWIIEEGFKEKGDEPEWRSRLKYNEEVD